MSADDAHPDSMSDFDGENMQMRDFPRSESPIFGDKNPDPRKKSAMLIDNDGYVQPDKENFEQDDEWEKAGDELEALNLSNLKQQITEANENIRRQGEEHRTQMLHVETINMMTKYQLVFIKLETLLSKLANLVKIREYTTLARSFKIIRAYGHSQDGFDRIKKQLFIKNMHFKMKSLFRTLTSHRSRVLGDYFKVIYASTQQIKFQQRCQKEREQTLKVLEEEISRKEREIANNVKKIEEQNGLINGLKTRESELASKAKQLDKHIGGLESLLKGSKTDVGRLESSKESRYITQKIKELTAENSILQERVASAEQNVYSFIKEMSEMLDPHELSTNVGSEDNSTLFPVQQNFEPLEGYEEFEPAIKGREASTTKAAHYDTSKRTLESLIQNKTANTTKHSTKQNKFQIH